MTKETIENLVNGMRERYEREVKPHIESGHYLVAWAGMADIVFILDFRKTELFSEIHSGISYYAAAILLRDSLETATEKPLFQLRNFEAMQAQTKLPLIKD